MINKRLFGAPIPNRVAKKLEARQLLAEQTRANESIFSKYPDEKDIGKDGAGYTYGDLINSDSNFLTDLSSRTPIVRMWTSVAIVNPEDVEDTLAGPFDPSDEKGMEEEIRRGSARDKATSKLEKLKTDNPGSRVVEIDGKFYIKSAKQTYVKSELANRIYVVGSNSLPEYTRNPYESRGLTVDDEHVEYDVIGELLPQELKKNPYLKPAAGITSVESDTQEMLGLTKKTKISFEVHNFSDFDKIYNRYFLKPGATIWVDFGWSTIGKKNQTLYDPQELLDSDNIKQYLYGEKNKGDKLQGVVTNSQGDLEVLKGIVTEYDAKIMENGSVQCSVEITSANSALLGFGTDDKILRKIQNMLDHGILYLALQPTLKAREKDGTATFDAPSTETINERNMSTAEIAKYNENLLNLAQDILTADDLVPNDNSVRTGVFVSSVNAEEVYMSFGLFEDLIINSQFGFGADLDDINNGENFQIRMDSSDSFTYYSQVFVDRQETLSNFAKDLPVFLVPRWWGDSDPEGLGGSYSAQVGKSPDSSFYEMENVVYQNPNYSLKDLGVNHTSEDKEKGRIPIREVFINTDIIIEGFKKNQKDGNIKKVINFILGKINDDLSTTMKWQIKQGNTDSELQIIDTNRLQTQNLIDSTGNQGDNDENNAFNQLFQFDIMSPNSIVKTYDIGFSLPSGNIGNMYAIQAMSHESSMFPLDDLIDQAIGLSSLDPQSMSIIYKPYQTGFRADQISKRNSDDASLASVYGTAQDLLEGSYPIKAVPRTAQMKYPQIKYDADDVTKGKAKRTKLDKKQLELEVQRSKDLGYDVVDKVSEYYNIKAKRDITTTSRPTLLPINLTLTTYGIASINPGDTFRVSYLPSMYRDRVYFQVMKVSQRVTSTGWETELQSQFRIRSDKKIIQTKVFDKNKVIINPKSLLNVADQWMEYQEQLGESGDPKQCLERKNVAKGKNTIRDFEHLLPRLRNIRIHPIHKVLPNNSHIEMIFSFEYGGTYSQYIRFPHKKRGTMWAVEQYNNFDDNDSYWLLTRAIKGSEKPYPFTYEGYGHQYYPLNSDRVFGHNGGPVFTDKNSGKMNFHDYGITLVPKGKYWLVKQDEYWAIVMKSANSDFPYDPEKFKNQRLSSYDFMTSIERESTFFDPKKPHKPITDSDNPGYRRIDA